jgi:signal transduction histidine kinase
MPLTRQVLQDQRPLVVTSVNLAETTARAKKFLQSRAIESFMAVPLMAGGSSVGVMSVNSAEAGRAFTPEEIRLAETIAADIAAAVANLHLLERMRETAALEERQRIASELHDSVTQTIYSVSLMAEGLTRLVARQRLTEAQHNAGQLRLMTLGAVAEMRTLLFELRPSALLEASLPALLQQLADVLTGQRRAQVDLMVGGQTELPAEIKIAFYRIAQEAFNNIIKHAEATHVAVTLQGTAEGVKMTVQDDGHGFDLGIDCPGCMGLRIMGERAEEIGARLQIDSQPGQGTKIVLAWNASDS